MDHVVILRKKEKILRKILEGKKTIETRWYMTKRAPRDRINTGDTVYLKESGEAICAKAKVTKVLQFLLDEKGLQTEKIVQEYGEGMCLSNPDSRTWEKKYKYAILVFLENVQTITPFAIDKTGYGIASAWLVVDSISTIAIGD